MINVSDQLKLKVDALRTVYRYCDELKKLRDKGLTPHDELIEIQRFIDAQINNYKELVKELNNRQNT